MLALLLNTFFFEFSIQWMTQYDTYINSCYQMTVKEKSFFVDKLGLIVNDVYLSESIGKNFTVIKQHLRQIAVDSTRYCCSCQSV